MIHNALDILSVSQHFSQTIYYYNIIINQFQVKINLERNIDFLIHKATIKTLFTSMKIINTFYEKNDSEKIMLSNSLSSNSLYKSVNETTIEDQTFYSLYENNSNNEALNSLKENLSKSQILKLHETIEENILYQDP